MACLCICNAAEFIIIILCKAYRLFAEYIVTYVHGLLNGFPVQIRWKAYVNHIYLFSLQPAQAVYGPAPEPFRKFSRLSHIPFNYICYLNIVSHPFIGLAMNLSHLPGTPYSHLHK